MHTQVVQYNFFLSIEINCVFIMVSLIYWRAQSPDHRLASVGSANNF